MKLNKIALLLALAPLAAFAGKAERDFVSTEVQPAIQAMSTAVKTSCGCPITLDAKIDTFKNIDEMWQIKNFANTVKDNAPRYCTDAPSKAAICKMKTIEFVRGNDVTFKFSGSKGVATAGASSYPSWDMVVHEVDK